jgi:hypothetical protein
LLDEIVHGFEASCFLLSKNVGHPVKKNLDSNGLRHPVILCDRERNSPTLKAMMMVLFIPLDSN